VNAAVMQDFRVWDWVAVRRVRMVRIRISFMFCVSLYYILGYML
jgi:hypothetical protein